MVELNECLFYIDWHGEVDLSLVIVPIECDSDVSFAHPVFRDVVVESEDFHQVSGVLVAFVFDAKIVNDKSELDWSCLMYPEAGHQLCFGGTHSCSGVS